MKNPQNNIISEASLVLFRFKFSQHKLRKIIPLLACNNSYGENCQYSCDPFCVNQTCDRFDGTCAMSSMKGKNGKQNNKPKKHLIADIRVTARTPFYSWIYTLQSREVTSQKKNASLRYSFKPNPILINSTWYDCDISSRGSIIFHKKGPGKGGCIYKYFRGLYTTDWLNLQNSEGIQGSEILKACILCEEKQCACSNSKVCY